MPNETSFLYKLRHITRYYRQFSKQNEKGHKWEELSTRAKLEVATASLHNVIYNIKKQGEVNQYKRILEEIETRKPKVPWLILELNGKRWGINVHHFF